ncbi:hypothetical protein [Rhodococcus sp. X156]|uniref:hypothetical protein n=1 Tax=Rhodococcus sp. X156 TaxID=2499145 RepID=UPI000FD6FAD7|nr:hypothetical protein [Rhodococcus sp. X156]
MPTLRSLNLAVDLRAEPWRYPGPALPFSALQVDDHLIALHGAAGEVDRLLADMGAAPLARRALVVGIGSNRCPDVLRRKLAAAGAATVVPTGVGVLHGTDVGHSAHVSQGGYVAATPFARRGATAAVTVSALSAEQLSCLDATEGSYDRRAVAADRLTLQQGFPLGDRPLLMYVSRWGVLGDRDRRPLPFGTQDQVLTHLGELGVVDPQLVGRGAQHTTTALAADPQLRREVSERMRPFARPCT